MLANALPSTAAGISMAAAKPWKVLTGLALVSAAMALAGCGESASPDGPLVRGVVTTSADCAGIGKLTLEQCQKAIDSAVAMHEANAPSYPSLEACEAAQGSEKCERTNATGYRPRLMAFIIVMGTPPYAEPLYPAAGTDAGFQTGSRGTISTADASLTFSRQALGVAETFATAKPAGGGGFGGM